MGRKRKRNRRRESTAQPDLLKEAGLDAEENSRDDEDPPRPESGEGDKGDTGGASARDEGSAGDESSPGTAASAGEEVREGEEPPAEQEDTTPDPPESASPDDFRLEHEPSPPPPTPAPRRSPAGWEKRVAEQEELGDLEGALEVVRKALEQEPADPRLLLREIQLLGSLGRFDEAEEPLRLLRLAEGSGLAVRRATGILFFRRGMYPEAEVELRAAVREGDTSGQSHYYLGESLNRMGKVEEALQILGEAVELNPSESRAYKTMGRLLDRKGVPEEAALMYRKARELEG